MKKIFITAVALLSLLVVTAQSGSDTSTLIPEKGDFTLSPQIGVSFASYVTNVDVSYKSRTSIAIGIVGEYYFSDRWSLRSGLLYSPMGAKDAGNNVDKLNYITLPLNANWHFGKKRNWYLNFGPAISFLANADSELSTGESIDISDAVKSTDVGFMLGIGYKFNVSEKVQLFIDYQGYGGFINVDDIDVLPFDVRNSTSVFNVGGVFKL